MNKKNNIIESNKIMDTFELLEYIEENNIDDRIYISTSSMNRNPTSVIVKDGNVKINNLCSCALFTIKEEYVYIDAKTLLKIRI